MTPIELRIGAGTDLKVGQVALVVAAGFALIRSGAHPVWISAALITLIGVHLGTLWWAWRHAANGILRLHENGSATFDTAAGRLHAEQSSGGWTSHWVCVVPVVEVGSGQVVRCVVCRSLNQPDSYRRLLVWLRLGGVPTGGDMQHSK